jgi:hypothetical protein
MNALPYDGHILDELDAACQRAERNAIDGGDPIPKLTLVTTPVRSLREWIIDKQKFDAYFEHRCLECEQEVEKVKGTDYCPTCLAKIKAEEL